MADFLAAGDPRLAALKQPSASTGGYVEPSVGMTSHTPATILPTSTVNAPVGDFATGVGGEHASGSIPSKANFAAGVGAEHASGDIPSKAAGAFGAVTGGGLATSPMVQALHSSNPQHSEGLTRAQLAQNNTQAVAGEDLSALSGRDQAAAQLGGLSLGSENKGVATNLSGGETPALEMPGGFALNSPASNPNTSVYQDLNAVAASTTQTLSSVASTTTSTLSGLFSQVKSSINEVADEIKAEWKAPPTASAVSSREHNGTTSQVHEKGAGAGLTLEEVQHKAEEALKSAQNFLMEGVHKIEGMTGVAVPVTGSAIPHTSTTTAVAPATSLPTDEFAGAQPGVHSDGVGALPGRSTETGVAILPEERKLGDGVTTMPNEGTSDRAVAPVSTSAPSAAAPVAASSSSSTVPVAAAIGGAAIGGAALAPALGAFRDATPYKPDSTKETGIPTDIGIAKASKPIAVVPASELDPLDDKFAPSQAVHASVSPQNNRMDSFTSTTAVLHGIAGDRQANKVPIPPSKMNTVSEQKTPPKEFSSFETDHKVPGSEHGAVGSTAGPSTGTTTAAVTAPVAPTPVANTDGDGVAAGFPVQNQTGDGPVPPVHTGDAVPVAEVGTLNESKAFPDSTSHGAHGAAVKEDPTPKAVGHTKTPESAHEKGHSRTDSNGSAKKQGLFSKIKAKMHHDK